MEVSFNNCIHACTLRRIPLVINQTPEVEKRPKFQRLAVSKFTCNNHSRYRSLNIIFTDALAVILSITLKIHPSILPSQIN